MYLYLFFYGCIEMTMVGWSFDDVFFSSFFFVRVLAGQFASMCVCVSVAIKICIFYCSIDVNEDDDDDDDDENDDDDG